MFKSIAWKFGIPLIITVVAVTYFAVPFVDKILTGWFRTDIESRAKFVMRSMEETLPSLLEDSSATKIKKFLAKVTADERLLAIVLCNEKGIALYRTEQTPTDISCPTTIQTEPIFETLQGGQGLLHIAQFPLEQSSGKIFTAVLVHDLSFIDKRQNRARDYLIAFMSLSAIAVILLCVAIAWLILRSWVSTLISDIQHKGFLKEAGADNVPANAVLAQVRSVLREIEYGQSLEAEFREHWTPEALQHIVKDQLDNTQIIAVSNREPYIHNVEEGKIVTQFPASGVVTALEPIVRACKGVWIAHGSGSADKKVVDEFDRVPVPPQEPSYTLRRIWLNSEEEEGYYYGFSNEGLWPLCHLAFVRPVFRSADWQQYVNVNRRFAEAVKQETRVERPLILVQDFHLALAPGYIRKLLPEATIATFWHIPWPNPETFGICPWKKELLQAMLQADIVGFHTRYHCQNFLDTLDRFVECHINREQQIVRIKDHVCHVAAYPISIEWPPQWLKTIAPIVECRQRVFAKYKLSSETKLGIGVERWDFTKGIVDRFLALEKLLEISNEWHGKLVFLQVAAPSRGNLSIYKEIQQQTLQTAKRVNERFGNEKWQPIILIPEHLDHEQIGELYRACDFCLVNSLHDGMNLVAKEFVAARDDEKGVLILSTFAGASRELVEALIVNPFDIDETARAIEQALRMPPSEAQERLRIMRQTIKENNVFRWAGKMLMDAARIRQHQKLERLSKTKSLPRWVSSEVDAR